MLITELIDPGYRPKRSSDQEERKPRVAGYTLANTRHIYDQARKRGIPTTAIIAILKRLGRARKFIDSESPNVTDRGLSLYDSQTGAHLIVKKTQHSDSNELRMITIYVNKDYRGLTPVFRVR